MFQLARSAWVIVCLILGGCALFGGGGGGTLPKSKNYLVDASSKWNEIEKAESDRAFRLSSGSIVAVNSSCTRNSQAPLEVLTKHLLFGARNLEYVERKKVATADGGEGLFSRVAARMDGTPLNLLVFVAARSGCIFDMSLVSPKEISEQDREDFLVFVKSFKYGN